MIYICISFLIFLSIIPLIFPYFAWIIIYKSRALFRLSSFIRFAEEITACGENFTLMTNSSNANLFFESLYREVRNDHWLTTRFTNNKFKNFCLRWRTYGYWHKKYKKVNKNYYHKYLISRCLSNPYLGAFYHRLIRFIFYMTIPFLLIGFLFSIKCLIKFASDSASVYSLITNYYTYPFIIYIVSFGLFYIYNLILIKRYLSELFYIPFSHDAQYIMWREAYYRLNSGNSPST